MLRNVLRLAGAFAALAMVSDMPSAAPLKVACETYTLPNGLTVILHPDHRLPQVVVNTWFDVGSKDEVQGKTGFAHLFEHLMFMGTRRVPGSEFDVRMESLGAANNAATSSDRTKYYSWGPPEALPVLLWLDADRLEGLGAAMTQEKLDRQRDVVRNEMREVIENTPYGVVDAILPEALYPAGHPYAHSVIGSHEDLKAASLKDVKDFFAAYYVPANATLVVAGDFDPAKAKELIAATFGAVPARPAPARRPARPAALDREVRRVAVDKVEFPRLYLVWPAPPAFAAGTAELNLAAAILSGGPSSRLERRLVHELQIAQNVAAFLDERDFSSEFQIIVTPARGVDIERVKRETLAALADLAANGPSEEELRRVKAQDEAGRLRGMESLLQRAEMLNAYRHYFGEADSFEAALARMRRVDAAGIKEWTSRVLGDGRVDLRVLPAAARVEGASLDKAPAPGAPASFAPPAPTVAKLKNGVELVAVSLRGSGLFAGGLVVDGGERAVPPAKAGLATLVSAMLNAGAGGKSAPEFAAAVESLGGNVGADARANSFVLAARGLSSRLPQTLDLFADAALRPNLAADDFDRERKLQAARIDSRADDPETVARIVSAALVYGRDDHRGRPVDGYAPTVAALTLDDVRAAVPLLLDPARARFVFVGDFDVQELKTLLEERFASWRGAGAPVPAATPLVETTARIAVVDRPGAPQTVIRVARPIPGADERGRAVRMALNTLFGGAFTSRLNQNLREAHGYCYGAGSGIGGEGTQAALVAAASVQTAVTGPALLEMKREFDRLAKGDVVADELAKAVRTSRYDLVESVATTNSLAGMLARIVADGRPLDALARADAALAAAGVDEVNAEARSGILDWSRLVVTLVGDRAEIEKQLKAAGFPAPVLVDDEGRPKK